MIINKKTIVIRKAKNVSVNLVIISMARDYINKYWPKLIKNNIKDSGTLVGLPSPYVVPSSEPGGAFQFKEQYYWDSFFTAIGMDNQEYRLLKEGMLDNLIYLRNRFGLIPNASRMYFTSRSQPPLLSSYVMYIYNNYIKPKTWLKNYMNEVEQEYNEVWMSISHPLWHYYKNGLNRYYDINALHDLAEAESGWDMTTRFYRKCMDFWPIDLNCLLYKYETDIALTAKILGNNNKYNLWTEKSEKRKSKINKYLWDEGRGFYYDYNFDKKKMGSVMSLAGYYSMWAGVASLDQAEKMVKNLSKFEKLGGLTTTTKLLVDMSIFGSVSTQWAYPNGWAPLHYIVIEGLEKYGYHEDAKRIALKWIKTNTDWYIDNREFLEKYNVAKPNKLPKDGVYPAQTGFGWTNGVYEYLCQKYIDTNS
ncbi:MAG: Alpha,alpha-trehalase [Patescibacteria group bacterium]|nr:Alpha,alpha-trehalase [Patescibacteria group bacterium]